MRNLSLIANWSISRARDTEGYNVITVRNLDTNKKMSGCNGGGYDMENTALCEAICKEYQDELRETLKFIAPFDKDIFMGIYRNKLDEIYSDGGCGDGVTRKLCEILGVSMRKNKVNSNCFIYRLESI